jgi:hypothetical protein
MCCDSAASSDSVVEAGAPADEIEITPAMYEVGILAWTRGDDTTESWKEIVGRIYIAMEVARKLKTGAPSTGPRGCMLETNTKDLCA